MNTKEVCAKCDHLSAMDLLPREQELPYRSWLQNFDKKRRRIASKILSRLIFINEGMAQNALSCAYQRLLRAYAPPATAEQAASIDRLNEFHESIIVAPIQGEKPRATDSGLAYMRTARDQLAFKDSQILPDPLQAAELAHAAERPVVLFDDISGSGDQIAATLTRRSAAGPSLATLALAHKPRKVACLTAVMTSVAKETLAHRFPNVGFFAGHTLDPSNYGVRGLFPKEQHPEIHELLQWAAQQLKVPPHVHNLYGYREFGLMLCFHNSIPDFSLPILWANGGPRWTPLKERYDG